MGEGKLNKNIQVSVSIVTYKNSIQEIKEALRCVLDSANICKVYIIDNSPSNELSELDKIDNRIEYHFLQKNIGFGRGHNIALNKSIDKKIEYHLILNPDVTFNNGTIEGLVNFLNQRPNCGMLMPKVYYKDGKRQYLCKKLPNPIEIFGRRIGNRAITDRLINKLELREYNQEEILNIPYLSGCFLLCRVDCFNIAGMFDERYFMYMEDLDLSRSFHRHFETLFYPDISIIHGYRSESKRNIILLVHHIISAIKYFTKYGWIFDNEKKIINKKLFNNLKPLEKQ